jgi:hypothetical protein
MSSREGVRREGASAPEIGAVAGALLFVAQPLDGHAPGRRGTVRLLSRRVERRLLDQHGPLAARAVDEVTHRVIGRRWRAMQCFRSFHTAERTIEGIEATHMMAKGQVKRLDGKDAAGQAKFVASLFDVAA